MLLEGSALIGKQAAHKMSEPAHSHLVYFSADVHRESQMCNLQMNRRE